MDLNAQEKENLQNQKNSYAQFLIRYEELKVSNPEYNDIFQNIIVSDRAQNIRIKGDIRCSPLVLFDKFSRALEFLGKISLEGVKKLEIEVNKFESSIELSLMKSFLINLSNLQNINSIFVNEFISKERNPNSFLLFMLYEPKNPQQIYTFTNYSRGRQTIATTQITDKGVINQQFEFRESTSIDGSDQQAVNELNTFFQALFELGQKIDIFQFIKDDYKNKKKSILVDYYMHSSILKSQLESVLYFLKLQNEDKRIKNFSLKVVHYQKERGEVSLADLSEFTKIDLFKKFKLKIWYFHSSHIMFIKQFLYHIKGIEIKNHFTSSSYNFEELLKRETVEQEDDKNNNIVLFDNQNFKTLKIADSHSTEECLGYQFQLIESFSNIKKAILTGSQQVIRQSMYQRYRKNIIDCFEKLDEFCFLRTFTIHNNAFTLNLLRLNFNHFPFSSVEDLIFSIKRPFSFYIESYNTLLQEEKRNDLVDFLKQIMFKTNIVSLKVCASIEQQYPQLILLVQQVKQFAVQEILYNKFIRQYMIYNPNHIYQDLFDFDE